MIGEVVHHLLSVRLRGAVCLAIFGRGGFGSADRDGSSGRSKLQAHLHEYAKATSEGSH
jgi:hypothetical protein